MVCTSAGASMRVWGISKDAFFSLEMKLADCVSVCMLMHKREREWDSVRFVSIAYWFYAPIYGFSRSFTRKKQIWFSSIWKIIFFPFCLCFYLAHFFQSVYEEVVTVCFTTTDILFHSIVLIFAFTLFILWLWLWVWCWHWRWRSRSP